MRVLRCLERICTALTIKVLHICRENPLWLGILRREVDSCLRIRLLNRLRISYLFRYFSFLFD